MKTIVEYRNFMSRDISYNNSRQELITSNEFRPVENENSKKRPIIIFGCSFAYGGELENSQTISYKLAQQTGRPIYNRARSGLGIQHMLFQLRDKEFYKIVPKPEYVIYIYMEGHPLRLTTPVSMTFSNCYLAFYKEKNGELVLKDRTFYSDKLLLGYYLSNFLANNYLYKSEKYIKNAERQSLKYLIDSKQEIDKNWKDTKFVVLFYRGFVSDFVLNELNRNGIITITSSDFLIDVKDKKYTLSETDDHPNGLAWDMIVPVIIKKLNL